MNKLSLRKITTPITATLAIATGALLTSCVQPLAQQQTAVQNQAQAQAQAANNPYAVPGLDGQVQQQYQQAQNQQYIPQNNVPAPYQPLPGVPSDPPVIQTPGPITHTTPTPSTDLPSTATTHDVVRGESLWRISRKYGVTIEAIQAANGLQNTNIWAGQQLNIPAAN